MDYSLLSHLPIIDGHVHFVHPEYLHEMIELLDEAGSQRANLVCIPNFDASTHNPSALYFKEHFPERAFISAALEYGPALHDPLRQPAALAEQIHSLKARGFDGLKLIEGKPQVRKLLPYPLDGPLYTEMWSALEEENLPVLLHVADPDEFWDPLRCPEWARQNGWDYSDGSYPAKEDFYTEVEHILTRHPGLKIILAHFYFLSNDLQRAALLLDRYPGVKFDLAPHMEMYQDFSQQPEAAKAFFLRYQDRIIYGTDLDTRALARSESGKHFMRYIPWLIRSFLEIDGIFSSPEGKIWCGIGLPSQVLEKIYQTNFEAFYLR